MSGMPSVPLCWALGFDATVTFTTAGVTRAAKVSMARSSVSNAPTLLSSSGAAAGAGAAAVADFVKLNVTTDLQRALQLSIHIFIFLSPCVTNDHVIDDPYN